MLTKLESVAALIVVSGILIPPASIGADDYQEDGDYWRENGW